MKTFSLRKFFAIFFLCLIPLVMLAFLYFDLETYKEITHNECGAFLCIESAPSSRCATAAAEKPFS